MGKRLVITEDEAGEEPKEDMVAEMDPEGEAKGPRCTADAFETLCGDVLGKVYTDMGLEWPLTPPAQGTDVDAHLGQHPPHGACRNTSAGMARQALQDWWPKKAPLVQNQMKAAKAPAAEAPH